MRVFFGIIFGLLFLVSASVYLLVFNANKTVLQPNYVKKLAEKASLYDKIPQIIAENILKEGNIPDELQDTFLKTVTNAITPQMVKNHLNSMIDQMLSNRVMITEDISDINSVIINTTDLGFLISSTEESIIPHSITFDKRNNNFGKFILNKSKIIWISLIGSIVFLFLVFFVASKNYKSRFKWSGAYFAVLAILILTNYLILHLVDFRPLINLIDKENSMSQTLDQVIIITNIVKNDFAKYFIYEFIILCVMSVMSFIIAALINKPPLNQNLGNKNETSK